MENQNDEWLILGITNNGKTFRPSDWAERLCGALASYNEKGRWTYSEYAQPVINEGKVCIRVQETLKNINPAHYQFLMDFARNNHLKLIPSEKTAILNETDSTTEIALSVRELTFAFLLHQWKNSFSLKHFKA